MNGLDHRDVTSDALLNGSKGEEVSQSLVLEVGLIKGLEWRVDIKITVKGNGKVGVMKVGGHVMEFLWGGEVCVEAMCVQGDIH